MKTIRLVAALCLAMCATPALATDNCYIREYAAIAQAPTQPAQIGLEPAITDQVTGDFTSGQVQSNTLNSSTSVVRIWCNVQASYLVGTNPTAANTNAPIAALTPEFVGVTPNSNLKISFHTNP